LRAVLDEGLARALRRGPEVRPIPPTCSALPKPYPQLATILAMPSRRTFSRVLLGLVVFLLLIQVVPYGRSHANPPVTRAPHWNSAQTRQLVASACADCHSNLTHWRWYSNVAPASWLVQNDVDGGRNHLNFSEWNKPQPSIAQVVHAIESGSMPPWQYKPLHPASQLSQAQRAALVRGLTATYKADPPPIRTHGGD
jgi:mono/diheme cytochrome c family protein